jgi:hypothetical protein
MGPMISAYLAEMAAIAPSGFELPKIEELEAGRALLEAAPRDQVLALRASLEALSAVLRPGTWNHRRITALQSLATRLLRKRLPLGSDDLVAIFRAMPADQTFDSHMPLGGLLRAAELRVEEAGLDAVLRKGLEQLHRRTQRSNYAATRKLAGRIGQILKGPGDLPLFQKSAWSDLLVDRIVARPPAAKDAWMALLEHAATAGGRSRPPQSWAREAAQRVTAVGAEAFAQELSHWLDALPLDPARPDPNDEVLKGLIWCAGGLDGESVAGLLGRFTERCFKKVPDIGARSVKLGNAGLHALGAIPEAGGVAELSRLSGKVRYPSVRKQIEKVLLAAAESTGKTIDELQEIAVPDFGLDAMGCRSESLGEFQGVIRITGSARVELTWLGPDGKSRKTVPAAVKRDHGEGLKQLKQQVKEIKDNLAGQGGRLERLLLAERRWPLTDWRALYLDHPLLAELCRRLIWRFEGGGRQASGIAEGDRITDQTGAPLDWLDAGTEVALWHPIEEPAERVLAWRNRLAGLEITQPFKQAHRETYVLTDAERRTGVYSNRFAAHILKQHQFKALCQQRGWRYELQGQWDSHNIPQIDLAVSGLSAEYWVDPAGEDDISPAYVYLYLASDQVRFLRSEALDEPMPLTEVPPLVFSEVMRDVDLFVGVASVANDPDWQDGGPEGRYRDYWWDHGFGDLSESAKTRHAVLAGLIPKLKIADRCQLSDRFLVVRGSKRSYKIHLGSGNILMEPNDQYLCIVRGYDKSGGEKIRLPFEGDGVLSMILSKAFLLAADDKITDRTILSQIGG